MIHNIQLYKEIYDKHLNLKLAANELNMKWQTLYWHLQRAGHPVIGNKEVYGSKTDKLARYTENLFKSTVADTIDMNDSKFQAKVDFTVKGYGVDIKSSTRKDAYKGDANKSASFRWAFCCKVQEEQGVDFLVCYCFSGEDAEDFGEVVKILLIPKEFFHNMQSISVSCTKSKWHDFEVSEQELSDFFKSL